MNLTENNIYMTSFLLWIQKIFQAFIGSFTVELKYFRSIGSFTVELKYFRSMPWYKAIFLSNFFNFILVLFRTLWYNRVG